MKFLFFIFILLYTNIICAFISIKNVSRHAKVDILINTNSSALGGQRLFLSIKSDGDLYEYIISATTGNAGSPTPDFSGRPYQLLENYTLENSSYNFKKAIVYDNQFSIYSLPLIVFHTSNEGQRSGEDCLTEGLACTKGSVGLFPKDAQLIFSLIKKVGLKNTYIKINKDLIF